MNGNAEFKTGDAPVVEDTNYQRMMRRLRRITRKGGELDAEALDALAKQEEEARTAKRRKKTDTAGGAEDDVPFLIQTKNARAAATAASSARRDTALGDEEGGADDNENSDDDDDPAKIVPSYIRDCMDESGAAANTPAPLASEAPSEAQREVMDENYYKRVQEVINDVSMPGSLPALPVIWIQNLVVTGFSDMSVNIEFLIPHLMEAGIYQNKRRFVAMTRRTCHPRSSTLAFNNGKFVNTGAQTVEAAMMSIRAFVDKIASVETQISPGVFIRPYSEMAIRKFTVHNMVGSTRTPFTIDLEALARYSFVTYFEKLFVGAIVTVAGISKRAEDKDVKALVFKSGNVVITGTKTTEHIRAVNQLIYPYLARCAVQSGTNVTKSRQRRFEADKRKATALPSNSSSIIQIDPKYLVAEFQAVNNNREPARLVLERERAENHDALQNIPKEALNMLAIQSMSNDTGTRVAATSSDRLLLEGPKKSRGVEIVDKEAARVIGE